MEISGGNEGGLAAVPPHEPSTAVVRLRTALRAVLELAAGGDRRVYALAIAELERAARRFGAGLRTLGMPAPARRSLVRDAVYGIAPPYYRDAPSSEATSIARQVVEWCLDDGSGPPATHAPGDAPLPPRPRGGRRLQTYDRRRPR